MSFYRIVPAVAIGAHVLAWGFVWGLLYYEVPRLKASLKVQVDELPPPLSVLFERPSTSSMLIAASDFVVVHQWFAVAIGVAISVCGWVLFAVPSRQREKRLLPVTALHCVFMLVPIVVSSVITKSIGVAYVSVIIYGDVSRAGSHLQ